MLFNTLGFIFVFVPVVYIGFFVTARMHVELAITWLVASSLFFYGWWNPVYLLLILGSIAFNYVLGGRLAAMEPRSARARGLLALGVTANLASIAYFKYAGFLVFNFNWLAGTDLPIPQIVLPLAISFFTFQQIAYLVDSWSGLVKEGSFTRYCLFVTFFPQLIAGPIVHHREMMPQFLRRRTFTPRLENFAVGATIFALGLFKKVVFADNLATVATPVFAAADAGQQLHFFQAWSGTVAYTMQLYFDFSGYSDMAIGAARIFGIRLPQNFNSPYKATSIVDFWRRWHITLSRFLRDYVYVALGGNRKGRVRRYVNLLATMLIGGLWHGAGWNFVIWGGLHGGYLVINHLWNAVWRPIGSWWSRLVARSLTLFAVMIAWVFFRAETLDGAMNVLRGMMNLPATLQGRLYGFETALAALGFRFDGPWVSHADVRSLVWLVVWLAIVWYLPNTQQIMARYRPVIGGIARAREPLNWSGRLEQALTWRPSPAWAVAIGGVFFAGVFSLTQVSEFLYFQF